MHAEQLLITQRALRMRLLDQPGAANDTSARDLAAMLLLHLGEPEACWRLSVQWLRETLGADRVDGGQGSPRARNYRPTAQALRPGRHVPSVLGLSLDNRASSIHAVWAQRHPILIDVQHDGLLDPLMRRALLGLGARRKLAVALYDNAQPVGLLCADWLDADARVADQQAEHLATVARDVLGPVLAAAQRLSELSGAAGFQWIASPPAPLPAPPSAPELARAPNSTVHPAGLSPAEWRVAQLVAAGLSYKEVAQRLNRSVSTIDHQLRSARHKAGVRTTARLVRWLAGQADPDRPV